MNYCFYLYFLLTTTSAENSQDVITLRLFYLVLSYFCGTWPSSERKNFLTLYAQKLLHQAEVETGSGESPGPAQISTSPGLGYPHYKVDIIIPSLCTSQIKDHLRQDMKVIGWRFLKQSF